MFKQKEKNIKRNFLSGSDGFLQAKTKNGNSMAGRVGLMSSNIGEKINMQPDLDNSTRINMSPIRSNRNSIGEINQVGVRNHANLSSHKSEIIQKEDKPKSKETTKTTTTVKVVGEHDFSKDESKVGGTAATESSTEKKVSDTLSSKTVSSTSKDERSGSGELKLSDKKTGLSGTLGIKGTEYSDPTKMDKETFYLKVDGKWTLFKPLTLKLGSSLKLSPLDNPAIAINGSAIFFPNGRLTPSLAAKLLFKKDEEKSDVTGSLEAGLSLKITDAISAKANVSVGTDFNGKISTKGGLGFTFKF